MDIVKYDLKPNAALMLSYLKEQEGGGVSEHVINHASIDRSTGISKHRQTMGLNELERKNLIMEIPQPDTAKYQVFKINQIKKD